MADVRLTATNPADSSVVPVACNEKGELLLEEPLISEGPPGPPGQDGQDGAPGQDGQDGDSWVPDPATADEGAVLTVRDGAAVWEGEPSFPSTVWSNHLTGWPAWLSMFGADKTFNGDLSSGSVCKGYAGRRGEGSPLLSDMWPVVDFTCPFDINVVSFEVVNGYNTASYLNAMVNYNGNEITQNIPAMTNGSPQWFVINRFAGMNLTAGTKIYFNNNHPDPNQAYIQINAIRINGIELIDSSFFTQCIGLAVQSHLQTLHADQ